MTYTVDIMENRFKSQLGLSPGKMEEIEKGIAKIVEQKQKESDDKIARLQDQVVKFTLKEEKMKKIVEKLLLAVQAQQDTISGLRREVDEINKRLGLGEFEEEYFCSGKCSKMTHKLVRLKKMQMSTLCTNCQISRMYINRYQLAEHVKRRAKMDKAV